MGWALAGDLPLGQKNYQGHVVVKNESLGDGRVRIQYYDGLKYYTREFAAGDKVTGHCCGSCKAAGTLSRTRIDPKDPVTRSAAKDVKRYKGHGI